MPKPAREVIRFMNDEKKLKKCKKGHYNTDNGLLKMIFKLLLLHNKQAPALCPCFF